MEGFQTGAGSAHCHISGQLLACWNPAPAPAKSPVARHRADARALTAGCSRSWAHDRAPLIVVAYETGFITPP